jgi:hypothetical protein
MRHFFGPALALALAATPALAARADTADDPSTADLKCLIVGFTMAQSTDPTQADAGKIVSFYYLGRLDGRDPSYDLEGRLVEVSSHMTPDEIRAAATRCGAALQARGQSIQAIGERLKARAAAAGQ